MCDRDCHGAAARQHPYLAEGARPGCVRLRVDLRAKLGYALSGAMPAVANAFEHAAATRAGVLEAPAAAYIGIGAGDRFSSRRRTLIDTAPRARAGCIIHLMCEVALL